MATVINGTTGIDKIQDGSVTSSKIVDGTIASGDMADGAVTLSKMAAGVIPASVAKVSSDPLITTNGSIGDQWINTTTGEMFILKDATTDANVWKGQSGSIVQLDMTVNFETRLYTGNSSTNTINMTDITTGVDFVWFKGRNNSGAHNIIDTIRGDTSVLYIGPNAVSSESSFGLSASSFTLQGSHGGSWNDNGGTYVAWCASLPNDYTNNDGSLTATIKTNGWMSAIKYGGAAGTQTVGHGLDAEPQFILLKVYGYNHYHVAWHYEMATSSVYDRKMYLNTDDAVSGTGQERITSTSATTFGIPAGSTAGGYSEANFTGYAHIAYAFTSVANKCKVGSYTGNSSTNIIDCGFDTEFVLLKPTSAAGGWRMFDATRGGDKSITANSSGPEYDDVQDYITITTTGFTCSSHPGVNASGVNYIFMAIAKQT
jgi:hypothetical protein